MDGYSNNTAFIQSGHDSKEERSKWHGNNPDIKCFRCRKLGHIARDCEHLWTQKTPMPKKAEPTPTREERIERMLCQAVLV